jgi:hypothetical protein
MNFSSIQFTPICFGSFNTVSFLFLLVFVLLVEGKGPRCSDGEFDSCAIHAHVTLLREGASWIIIVDDWDDWFAS